ncbi:unnamed protein product [Auanema sp. JU1783]|nr:unnamed protein product [Auanema sp. JU1783]
MTVTALERGCSDSSSLCKNSQDSQCLESFKKSLYKTQEVRRQIVTSILSNESLNETHVDCLKQTLSELTDSRTTGEMRHISTSSATFSINIRDEIRGLEKDVEFLSRLLGKHISSSTIDGLLDDVDLPDILSHYHSISVDAFQHELENTTRFLLNFVNNSSNDTRKPFFVTDWDGTMKDYCSQYATNLQPIYSAVVMGRFSTLFTRATAVLTAGPLRGPGILDLTALPLNGPVLFSGSWGREWWMRGKRVVHEDGISDEAFDAISRLSDELTELIDSVDYAQFALVGSGVQRKVDRLTLGVQTVFGHVPAELTSRYIDAVKERMHRIDPNMQVLKLDEHNHLEIEICAHAFNDEGPPKVWDKANGVAALIESLNDSLEDGLVLVAGDTSSDLPMLRHVFNENPKGVMALFVGANEDLKSKVRDIVKDDSRVCFISTPDVVHAAFARLIASTHELD